MDLNNMKEEFNLSSKRNEIDYNNCRYFCGWNVYPEEDVKEFIKRLKESFDDVGMGCNTVEEFREKFIDLRFKVFDKLAGDKLI